MTIEHTRNQAQQAILGVKALISQTLAQEDVLYTSQPSVGSALKEQPGFLEYLDGRYWFKDGSHIFYSEFIDAFVVGM